MGTANCCYKEIIMNELQERRKELDQLKYLINSLYIFNDRLPDFVMTADLYSFLDEIKYLCGYMDCMISFNIPLNKPPQ